MQDDAFDSLTAYMTKIPAVNINLYIVSSKCIDGHPSINNYILTYIWPASGIKK